MKQRTA